MSKAILIMDMSENCIDCPCSYFERSNPELNLICGQTQEDVNGGGKPNWCPLKDMDELIDSIRCRCYEMGLDESQAEIIVNVLLQ